MCGRYALTASPQVLAELFRVTSVPELRPRYNIAPTQEAPIVRVDPQTGTRQLDSLQWGLTPPWAEGARSIINARSETVANKPAFKTAFRHRRCLVPATGFYEWQKLGDAKQPFHFRLPDQEVFAFAGIWDHCGNEDGNLIEAFAILTTSANETVRPIHNRMPVILDPAAYSLWLDPELADAEPLRDLLRPWSDEQIMAYPVTTKVGNSAFDDPACVQPLSAG